MSARETVEHTAVRRLDNESSISDPLFWGLVDRGNKAIEIALNIPYSLSTQKIEPLCI